MAQSSFNGFIQPKKDGGKDYSWYAEGNAYGSSGLLPFYRFDNATSFYQSFITINGLNFPGGIKNIVITNATLQTACVYTVNEGYVFGGNNSPIYFSQTGSSNPNVSARLDGVSAFVTKNSFQMPVGYNNATNSYIFKWRAWG